MSLFVDPWIPRFTRAALVAEMSGRYGGFTDGAFRRWQEWGLIAAPQQSHRWPKGHEGSTEGLWTGHDREMLLALLEKRQELRSSGNSQFQPKELANLVVWSWIYSDGVVHVDQARRALRTWAKRQVPGKQRSKATVLEHARQAVTAVAAPGQPRRTLTAMATKIAGCLYNSNAEGLYELKDELAGIIDPSGVGRGVQGPGASIDAGSEIERLIWGHRAAEAIVTGSPNLEDRDFLAVRQTMRAEWVRYSREWLSLRARASNPDAFGPPDLALQMLQASPVFLVLLGSHIESLTSATSA